MSGGRVTSQKDRESPGRHPGEARRGREAPRGGQVSPAAGAPVLLSIPVLVFPLRNERP